MAIWQNVVAKAMAEIKPLIAEGPSVEKLEDVKARLNALCTRRDIFTFDAFPLDPGGGHERTYLIAADADGSNALYVNAGRPGQTSRPHDHGPSWAVVCAVHGTETHRLFAKTGDATAPLDHRATVTVAPGHGVSLMPGGVHAICADGDAPLLHLHLYGLTFERQAMREEFDEMTNATLQMRYDGLEKIIDLRG